MPEENRPASNEQAPDPARSYERAKPEAESGMGRLDNIKGTPTPRADKLEKTVTHRQGPRQINADQLPAGNQPVEEQAQSDQAPADAGPTQEQPDHSMLEEEPLGWDQAPTDIKNNREKRHPKTDGKGGTR